MSKQESRTMSTVWKLAVIALLIEICVQSGRPQQCSVDRLPNFGDTVPRTSPERDRFQAIVPAYRFNCSGRVAEWGACVQPGGDNEEYFIQFQIWRPTGPEGCYELVGYNEPPVEGSEANGILNPVDHCVLLTVRENEQIDFQPGDVVGYYVDHFRYGNMSDDGSGIEGSDGGIQWIEDNEVLVHYRDDLPREDIKSQYALNGPNPTECGFQISGVTSGLHTLSDSSTSAPIISLSLAMTAAVPLLSSLTLSTSTSSSRPVVFLPTPSSPSAATPATMTIPVPLQSHSSSSSRPVVLLLTPSALSSTTMNPSTSSSCSTGASLDIENRCDDSPDAADNTKRNVTIICVTAAILIIMIVTVTIIAICVLLWLGKRKRDVTDHSDDILESNSAYNTVNVMDTNDSYAASSVPTSDNTAYLIDQPPSVDIVTSANEAYVSTDITTSVNAAYQQPLVYDYVRHN